MSRRIHGIVEAIILVLLGAGVLWFALSGNYGLLMNEKFRPLTVAGAGLVLLLGVAALASSQKRPGINSVIFALMLVLVAFGKPYLPPVNAIEPMDPALEAGLWAQVDLERFPRKQLQDVCMKDADALHRADASFTTVGVVKRLETLDGHRSFALMTTVMFCCLADAFAVGLRVPCDRLDTIQDGQWIMISGKLAREETEIPLPNFRFGRAMMSTVDKTYYLQPEKIMSYSQVAQLPLLTAQLEGTTEQLFVKALQTSGVWERLKEKGPYTVFVPVDKAIENLRDVSLDEMSPAALRRFASMHIVPGRLSTLNLMERDEVQSLAGERVKVELVNGKAKIGGSRILFGNTEARNGMIHFIYPALTPVEYPTDPSGE